MPVAAYHVDGPAITTTTRLKANGEGIEDVHRVPYVIDSGPAKGLRRTVDVPSAGYTTESVKSAIESDLATTHAVASLRHGG
jgi:hypothetical protein